MGPRVSLAAVASPLIFLSAPIHYYAAAVAAAKSYRINILAMNATPSMTAE